MNMRRISDFLYDSEPRFMRIFYAYFLIFTVGMVVTACSTDLHGVNVAVIRKQPEATAPTVVVPPPSQGVGGS